MKFLHWGGHTADASPDLHVRIPVMVKGKGRDFRVSITVKMCANLD